MDRPRVDSARSKVQTFLDSTAAEINPGAASNLSFAALDVFAECPSSQDIRGTPTNRIPRLSDTLAEEVPCRV